MKKTVNKSHETGMFFKNITKHQKLENQLGIIGKLIQKAKVSFTCKFYMNCKICFFIFSQTKLTSKYDDCEIDIFNIL